MKWNPGRVARQVVEAAKFWTAFGLVAVLVGGIAVSCNPVVMVAPPGSSITLFANPDFIPAHDGVSEITAFVMESTGSPVADGTVVQFFTSLGRIEEQGKTNDGVARVKLVADSRSGTARITAFSGGGSVSAPTGTATPTGTSTTPAPTSGGGGGGTVSGTISVTIGSINVSRLIVNAIPNRITNSASSHIIATALDSANNPVANVPVYFSVDGNPGNERMDSGGNPIFTDNNGRAEDIMRTVGIGGASYTVTIKAQTIGAGGTLIEGTTRVTIN